MLVTRGLGLNQNNPTRLSTMGLGLAGAISAIIAYAFAGIGLFNNSDEFAAPG